MNARYNDGLFLLTSYVSLDYALSRLFYLFYIYTCVGLMDVLIDVLKK